MWILIYHLIGFNSILVIGVEQLHHWVLIGLAVVVMGDYDFMVEME